MGSWQSLGPDMEVARSGLEMLAAESEFEEVFITFAHLLKRLGNKLLPSPGTSLLKPGIKVHSNASGLVHMLTALSIRESWSSTCGRSKGKGMTKTQLAGAAESFHRQAPRL